MSSVRGSTSASTGLPFTFSEMCVLAIVRLPHAARDLARASARDSITPAILVRYCGVPRRSEAGDVIASAAATAFFTVAASSVEPARIFAASSAKSGLSATLVRPIAQVADLAALQGQHHGRGGGGVVADLPLQLLVGVAVACRRRRNADRGQDLARLQRGDVGALIEVARRDLARAALARRAR